MGVIGFAVIRKLSAGKKIVVLRKMIINGCRQGCHVACRRNLSTVGKAGGIFENGIFHSQRFGDFSHLFGKFGFAVTESLRQYGCAIVGGFNNQSINGGADFQLVARFDAETRRRSVGGVLRNREQVIHFDDSFFQGFKSNIQCHQFGQRSRMMRGIRVLRRQNFSGFGVDNNAGSRRATGGTSGCRNKNRQ